VRYCFIVLFNWFLKVSDNKKLLALNNIWAPTPRYIYRSLRSCPTTGNRHLKFQYTWLQKYNWLCFSQIQNGAYCKVCIFFSLKQGVGCIRYASNSREISIREIWYILVFLNKLFFFYCPCYPCRCWHAVKLLPSMSIHPIFR